MEENSVIRTNRPTVSIGTLRRWSQNFMPLLFLLVLSGGLTAWVCATFHSQEIAAAKVAPGTTRELLRGFPTAEIDRLVEEYHPARNPALHFVTAMRLLLFREGTGPVVVGERRRLYTLEEFEYHLEDRDRLDERLRWISRVVDQIAEERIVPVIVMVPSKSRVEQQAVPGRLRPLTDHPRYDRALQVMAKTPAVVVAPLEELRVAGDSFLATDTHWSPRGAMIAAGTLAVRLQAVHTDPIAPGTAVEMHSRDPLVHEGDLLQFLPLGPWREILRIEGENLTPREAVVTESPPAGGLFDLPKLPVSLVGTSFSAGDRWNFAGELMFALQTEVLNVSREGEGPFVPMYDYLTGETYREITPSVIVWEIPERYLTLPGIELPELPEL